MANSSNFNYGFICRNVQKVRGVVQEDKNRVQARIQKKVVLSVPGLLGIFQKTPEQVRWCAETQGGMAAECQCHQVWGQ